jgi:hypothetical protein
MKHDVPATGSNAEPTSASPPHADRCVFCRHNTEGAGSLCTECGAALLNAQHASAVAASADCLRVLIIVIGLCAMAVATLRIAIDIQRFVDWSIKIAMAHMVLNLVIAVCGLASVVSGFNVLRYLF